MAGPRLRAIREKCGLTLREVERRSRLIAHDRSNIEYLFTAGRLSQIENGNSLPSVFKLATLSEVYRVSLPELLRVFGIDARQQNPDGRL